MSFTLSGAVITQAGFDASLAGLSGLSGVTVSGEAGGKFRYLLTGRQLVVNGSLIIDPEVETLEFDTTSAVPNLTYNGRFQIGRKRASAGEVTTVTTTTATGLGGKHFTFNDGTTAWYVWFTVDGVGSNPNPGGTGILCAVLGADTNAQVATKIQASIMSVQTPTFPQVDVSVSSNVVTIRNNRNVTATDATAATSGFTVTVTQQGSATGMVRYSDGDALIFSRQGTDWAGGGTPSQTAIVCNAANTLFIGHGGRINTGLAVILCGGPLSTNGLVGHAIIEQLLFYARTAVAGQAVQFRLQHLAGSTVTVSGLTLDCDGNIDPSQPSVFGSRFVAPTSFSAVFKSFQLQNLNQLTPPAGDFTFSNLVFANNYRPLDIIGNYSTAFGAAVPVWNLQDTDVGTATRISTNITSAVNSGKLNVVWTQTVNARLRDSANVPITSDALIWLTEANDGARFEAVGRTGFNWLTVQTYSQSANASGVATASVRIGTAYVARDAGPVNTLLRSYFGKSSADNFDIYAIGYLYNIASGEHILRGIGGYTFTQPMVTDALIAQTVRATVDAYSTIDTPQRFYDRAKSWLVANYAGQTATLVTRTGNVLNAGSRNVVIDATAAAAFAVAGNTITIRASTFTGDMVTTGTITLVNGATFAGSRTDASGTISQATFTLTGLEPGTEIRVYRVSDDAEIAGIENTPGTTFSYTYAWSADVPIYLTVSKPGFRFQRITNLSLTQAPQSIPVFQQVDLVYSNPV